MESLSQLIERRHAELDISMTGVYDLLGSQKRYTRQVNRPKRMTLETLLRLAKRIEVDPAALQQTYDIGAEMIPAECLALLKDHYRTTAPQTHCRDYTTQQHIRKPPHTEGAPECSARDCRASEAVLQE